MQGVKYIFISGGVVSGLGNKVRNPHRVIDRATGSEIDEYASTVIGTEQLKKFATLYGAPLVGGSVEYHGEERYHFFDSADAFEYRGFEPAITYKVWQGALENHLDNSQ